MRALVTYDVYGAASWAARRSALHHMSHSCLSCPLGGSWVDLTSSDELCGVQGSGITEEGVGDDICWGPYARAAHGWTVALSSYSYNPLRAPAGFDLGAQGQGKPSSDSSRRDRGGIGLEGVTVGVECGK